MIEEPDWSELDTTLEPRRKDGYRPRSRIQIRVDDESLNRLDSLAEALGHSRAYLCDLILSIAADEGGEWLRDCIMRRVEQALQLRRERWK